MLDVPGGAVAGPSDSVSHAPSARAATVTERLVVVPRDCKYPVFNGKTGIGIAEWMEEIRACMWVRHLSVADHSLFIFDHLEGEAREEIRFRPIVERGDPAKVLAISRFKKLYLSRGKLLCNSYNTKWEEENRESIDNINKIKKSKIKIK